MTQQERTRVKELDLDIALSIASAAGISTRDKLGNIHDDIWTQYVDKSTICKLIEPNDVRKLLMEQLKNQLESKKEMLAELEDNEVVCQWVIGYTKAWEKAYMSETQKAYDIGRKIRAVMHDTFYEIREILDSKNSEIPLNKLYEHVARAHRQQQNAGRYWESDEAVVRFLFRNEYTRYVMCRIAGKVLQKKEVCNKAGAYSTKQQRNDITTEKDGAVRDFYHAVMEDDQRFKSCLELLMSSGLSYYIIDHSTDVSTVTFDTNSKTETHATQT